MADNKLDQKQQAQFLYMAGGKTQKEIAALVGISERTIYTWIHELAWDKLRLASFQAPATIADNLCSQLVELQNVIAAREPGQRFPAPQEAETTRKLIAALEKMKKYPSLAQNMQILETFRNYMRPVDKDFTRQLATYTERFLTAKSVNGYAPFQVEYGVDPVPPVLPCYDEVEESPGTTQTPCASHNDCLHEGNCTYPRCRQPEWCMEPAERAAKYNIPIIHFRQNQAHAHTASAQKAEATGSSIDQQTESIPVVISRSQPEATGSDNTILRNSSLLRPPKPCSGEGGSGPVLSLPNGPVLSLPKEGEANQQEPEATGSDNTILRNSSLLRPPKPCSGKGGSEPVLSLPNGPVLSLPKEGEANQSQPEATGSDNSTPCRTAFVSIINDNQPKENGREAA